MTCLEMLCAFVYRWQTLIAGLLALLAALAALRPVHKQLALQRAQSSVMVRETIGHMIQQLDAHRARVDEIMSKRLTSIQTGIHHIETHGPASFDLDMWAEEQNREFGTADADLKTLFATAQDVEAIEREKAALLASVDSLTDSLWDIWKPEDESRFPENYEWTDDERAAAHTRSNEAEKEIEPKADAVSTAVWKLRGAYAAQRAGLVKRLRVIDDGLLTH